MVQDIASTESIASTANKTPTKADSALTKFSADFESFLKIFVTQLENQDPLAPQDSSDFTGQIAQFSTVEQAVQSNQNLEKIVDIFSNNSNANIVSYSGKFVEVVGDMVSIDVEGDSTTFNYTLEDPARSASVSIYDTEGTLVYTADAITSAGQNYITWEGKDSSGNNVAAGKYRVEIGIIDQEQNIQTVQTVVKGRVDGVNLEGEPVLIVNGKNIPLDDVKFIGEA